MESRERGKTPRNTLYIYLFIIYFCRCLRRRGMGSTEKGKDAKEHTVYASCFSKSY